MKLMIHHVTGHVRSSEDAASAAHFGDSRRGEAVTIPHDLWVELGCPGVVEVSVRATSVGEGRPA